MRTRPARTTMATTTTRNGPIEEPARGENAIGVVASPGHPSVAHTALQQCAMYTNTLHISKCLTAVVISYFTIWPLLRLTSYRNGKSQTHSNIIECVPLSSPLTFPRPSFPVSPTHSLVFLPLPILLSVELLYLGARKRPSPSGRSMVRYCA